MQVSVVKITEPKNLSIPASMAVGGAVGIGLRYAIPVYKPEMDYVMFNKADALKEDAMKTVKNNFIEQIQKCFNQKKDDKVFDLFLQRAKAESGEQVKKAKALIKQAPEEIQRRVNIFIDDMAAQMRVSKNLTVANIKNAVKQQRPYSHFILPGVAIGALVAYAYNVVGTIKED